jgi:hypothetical protein
MIKSFFGYIQISSITKKMYKVIILVLMVEMVIYSEYHQKYDF